MEDRLGTQKETATRKASAPGKFLLPPLPYDESALAPAISARTLRFHHGKHHKAYVEKLNELIKDTELADQSLEAIIKSTAGDRTKQKIFNNAAQSWNHTFYWQCLSPKPSRPGQELSQAIKQEFGGLTELKETLEKAGEERFGSGWVWLVSESGKLRVVDTGNADTPMAHGANCLLAIDVWEHAYYLDYQNDRKAHLKAVVDGLVDWGFASDNFERAR
jgi:Fe-Mn family superoxide dismutase